MVSNVARIMALIYLVTILCLSAHLHGKPQGPHSFWPTLAFVIVWLALLFLGGFWPLLGM